MEHACTRQFKSPFFRDRSRPTMAECAMLQPVVPMRTFQNEAGIPEMGIGDRHADRELIDRCLSGSEQAWTDFYNRYHPLIEAVVKKQARSSTRDVREDLVQEVYKSLVEALARYDGHSSSLRTFVSTVAQRTCIDCWRGGSRKSRTGKNEPVEHHDNANPDHVVLESQGDPPDEQVAQAEYVNLLRIALSRLSEKCRELLNLRFFAALTHKAIADKLGEKENTVNVQMIRCIAHLRSAFALLEGTGQRV